MAVRDSASARAAPDSHSPLVGYLGLKTIVIAVIPGNQRAGLVADALDHAVGGCDVERAAETNCRPAMIRAYFLAFRYGRLHAVPGLEAMDVFLAHQVTARKAVTGQAGALIATPTHAADLQCRQ